MQVYTLNTGNLSKSPNEVEVHSPTCQHVAQYRKDFFFEEGWVEEFGTAQQVFNDYNADFYAEAEEGEEDDNCWPVVFFPCSGLVSQKTTIDTWVD